MLMETNTEISLQDYMGAMAVRCGFNRNGFTTDPGLYSLNRPQRDSPVFVTANYKLTFDKLRKELKSISCYILVLDTRGINVWCAAGKGTFGTDEIIRKVKSVNLKNYVDHRKLILPQLGAPGVEAHKVRLESGFNVVYGPVEACDISEFIKNGMVKEKAMRYKSFTLAERALLIPLELRQSWKVLLPVLIFSYLLGGLTQGWNNLSLSMAIPSILGVLSGSALTPLLLPYIPFRAFALKGFLMGVLSVLIWIVFISPPAAFLVSGACWILALSSFLAMYFTGASSYTSLSGVKKEMAIAVPIQLSLALLGPVVSLILTYTGVFS